MRASSILALALAGSAVAAPLVEKRNEVVVVSENLVVDGSGHQVSDEKHTVTTNVGGSPTPAPQAPQPAAQPAAKPVQQDTQQAPKQQQQAPTSSNNGGSSGGSGTTPPNPDITNNKQFLDTGSQLFKDMSLWFHNVHRANHSAPAMTYDDNLSNLAQEWANQCQYPNDKVPGGVQDTGINVAESTNQNFNPSEPLTAFYDEVVNFKFGQKNQDTSNQEAINSWAHFAQMVSPKSSKVGCATKNCGGNVLYGCIYQSDGNIQGQFDDIQSPKGMPTIKSNQGN